MSEKISRILVGSLGVSLFALILIILFLILWGTARNIRLYALKNPIPVLSKELNPIAFLKKLFTDIFAGNLGRAATAIIDNPIKSAPFLAIVMVVGFFVFALMAGLIQSISGQ